MEILCFQLHSQPVDNDEILVPKKNALLLLLDKWIRYNLQNSYMKIWNFQKWEMNLPLRWFFHWKGWCYHHKSIAPSPSPGNVDPWKTAISVITSWNLCVVLCYCFASFFPKIEVVKWLNAIKLAYICVFLRTEVKFMEPGRRYLVLMALVEFVPVLSGVVIILLDVKTTVKP